VVATTLVEFSATESGNITPVLNSHVASCEFVTRISRNGVEESHLLGSKMLPAGASLLSSWDIPNHNRELIVAP
jgi:hypothetical protein